MANPVTHIIVPMLIVETFRRYIAKKRFSRWYVFAAGLIGAMPDFDLFYTFAVTGSFSSMYHRGLTHSLLIPFFLLVAGLLVYLLYSKKVLEYEGWKVAYMLLFVGSAGLVTHTLLDGMDGMSRWFYPLAWEVHLPNIIYDKFRAGILDGALMLVWLLYDEERLDDILRYLRLKK